MSRSLNVIFLVLAVLIVLSAGCTRKSQNSPIKLDFSVSTIHGNQEMSGSVAFQNQGPELKNFTIYLIDDGTLNGDCHKQVDDLRNGEIALAHCSFYSSGIKGPTDVMIGFSFNHNMTLEIPDIEFVSKKEFERNNQSSEQKTYHETDGYVSIDAHFIQPMPFRSGDNVSLVMTIKNDADGLVDVRYFDINDPYGIVKDCYNMKKEGNRYVPVRKILVRNGMSNDITCVLNHETDQYLNIKSMKINLGYHYLFTRSKRVVVE